MARGRPPSVEPGRLINISIDEKLMARLDIEMFSEAEGRIPRGSYKRVFEMLLRRFWSWKELDLAPYLGTLPGEAMITAAPAVLDRLKTLLEKS